MRIRLGTKIFLACAAALLVLAAVTLALVTDQTTRGEERRINHDLLAEFERVTSDLRLHGERTALVVTPQIYEMRRFLDDPRDNFVTFARDFRRLIAATSFGGRTPTPTAVLVSDDAGRTLALDIDPHAAWAREAAAPERLPGLHRVFESARRYEYVGVHGGRVVAVTHLPVTRLETDEVASTAVTVISALDSVWLERIRAPSAAEGMVLCVAGRVHGTTLPVAAATDVAAGATMLGEAEIVADRQRFLVWVHEFPSPGTPTARFVLAQSLDAALAPLVRLQQAILLASGGVLAAALLATALFARRIAAPLGALSRATRRVAEGDLDFAVAQVDRGDEVGDLARAFEAMIAGLRDRERIKATFGKYVAPAIVEDLLAHPEKLALGGDRKALTVYFSDLKGFTTLSETLGPEVLVSFLNEYLTAMTDAIIASGGIVDKYIGDAVVAFWTRPFFEGNHAAAACRAALANQRALKALRGTFARPELRGMEMRIGLSSGEAVVGNIGSNQLRGYTAIGDVVNLGARLEGANKAYGTSILISEGTRLLAGGEIVACEVDLIRVVGKKIPVRVFELVGMAGDVEADELRSIARFERALGLYRERRFEDALDLLEREGEDARTRPPEEGVEETRRRMRRGRERAYIERCQAFLRSPPPEGWDGVFESTSK